MVVFFYSLKTNTPRGKIIFNTLNVLNLAFRMIFGRKWFFKKLALIWISVIIYLWTHLYPHIHLHAHLAMYRYLILQKMLSAKICYRISIFTVNSTVCLSVPVCVFVCVCLCLSLSLSLAHRECQPVILNALFKAKQCHYYSRIL